MKTSYTIFIVLFLLIFSLSASAGSIFDKIYSKHQTGESFKEISLFENLSKDIENILSETITDYELLKINTTENNRLLSDGADNIELIIPLKNGRSIVLELFKEEIVTPGFTVITASDDKNFIPERALHYRGIIKGDPLSLAAISIFENEIMGMFSCANGNYVIGLLKDNTSGIHIFYNDAKLKSQAQIDCHTTYDLKPYSAQELKNTHLRTSVNCIRLYWEVNYDIFQSKGTVANTINYVTGLFNQSAVIYTNDNIPVTLSQVYVWNIPSPYNSGTTLGLLNQFQAYRNTFNGDLAHLLGYSGGGGVAAGINGLCNPNPDLSQCYSGIQAYYNTVPVYSWSVTVVTHEQGHLLGSRHTHACVWNGNATAIDGCGPAAGYQYEGLCSGASIPPGGGTIMSYCHLTSAGINFANGFGSQPAAVILSSYNNASCLTACNTSSCSDPANLTTTSVSTTTATFSWDTVPGAIRYRVQYRILGTVPWITDSTNTNIYYATSLTPATDYEWQVQTICSSGSSFYSSSSLFTTVPLTCDPPLNLVVSALNSFSVLLNWDAVPGAAGYIVIYREVGTSLWNSLIVNVTQTYISSLNNNTQYEWQVSTSCIGGATSSNSVLTTFTTLAKNHILLKPSGDCGKDALVWVAPPYPVENANYGSLSYIHAHAWTNSSVPDTSRFLVAFDLSSIPLGSTIQSAHLSLYNDSGCVALNGIHSSLSHPNTTFIRRVISPWNEFTVSWNDQPATTLVNQVALPASTSPHQDYLNIDVKQLVIDMLNDPEHSFGFMMRLQQETYYSDVLFASSDHPDVSKHPQLEIIFTTPPDTVLCYRVRNNAGCGGDAFIWNSQIFPNNSVNYDTDSSLIIHAWTNSGVPDTSRSLMNFDFSMLPMQSPVSSATISLFNDPLSIHLNGEHSTFSGSNAAWIGAVISSWRAPAVTWNAGIQYTLNNAGSIPMTTNVHQDFPGIDVTALTQDMVNSPLSHSGYIIKLQSEINYRALIFASSDNPDGTKHPYVDVCVSTVTGTDNINEDNTMMIYPNPASSKLHVNFKSASPKNLLFITDILGQIVYQQRVNENSSGEVQVDVSLFAEGLYNVTVFSDGTSVRQNFIVMH
jgi:hypothetical protein